MTIEHQSSAWNAKRFVGRRFAAENIGKVAVQERFDPLIDGTPVMMQQPRLLAEIRNETCCEFDQFRSARRMRDRQAIRRQFEVQIAKQFQPFKCSVCLVAFILETEGELHINHVKSLRMSAIQKLPYV